MDIPPQQEPTTSDTKPPDVPPPDDPAPEAQGPEIYDFSEPDSPEPEIPKPEGPHQGSAAKKQKVSGWVKVAGLNPKVVTTDLLAQKFGGHGNVFTVHLKASKKTAFIEFETREEAFNACIELNTQEAWDKPIAVVPCPFSTVLFRQGDEVLDVKALHPVPAAAENAAQAVAPPEVDETGAAVVGAEANNAL